MFFWACSSGGGPVPAGFAGPIPLGLFLCPPLRGGPVAVGLPPRAPWRRLGGFWSCVPGTLFLTLPRTNPSGGGGREAGGHEGGWAHHNVEERWSRGRVWAPWDGAFTCKEGLTRRWPVGLAYCYCQRSAIAHQASVPLGCSSSMHAGHQ